MQIPKPDINETLLLKQMESNKFTLLTLASLTAMGVAAIWFMSPQFAAPTKTIISVKKTFDENITNIKETVTKQTQTPTAAKPTGTTGGGIKAGIKRPVYLVSDNISGKTKDQERLTNLCAKLKAKGLSCTVYGIGPDKKNAVLKNSKVPQNAVVVDIAGGACAGTIWEKGQAYYKKWKGSRKVFMVWCCGSTNITGLAYLRRAHDDNFSKLPGLARPDVFLKQHGYDYIYSNDWNAVANRIYAHATS